MSAIDMLRVSSGKCYVLTLLVLFGVEQARSGSAQNVTKLLNDLLLSSGYSKYIRPVQDQSTVLELKAGFHLISILAFDEVDDQLTIKGSMHASWTDEFLTWEPVDYDGTESINVPSEMIWIPNLIMTSSNAELTKFDVKGDNLRLYSNGTIQWIHADVYKSRCLANVKNFPIDHQSCNVLFTAFGYLPSEFQMTEGKRDASVQEFDNGQWTRESVSISYEFLPSTSVSMMNVTINFHRKYLFMLLNILVPIVMLNSLCTLVFFIPAECGEKVAYAVTLLLSNTVFLLLLSDNLPKISDPVPTVCIYLIISMMISLFICLCTIVNARLFHRNDELTLFWRKFLVMNFCCLQGRESNKVADNLDSNSSEDLDTMKHTDESYTWKDVSRRLDRLLFISFTVLLVVINLSFVIYINIAV